MPQRGQAVTFRYYLKHAQVILATSHNVSFIIPEECRPPRLHILPKRPLHIVHRLSRRNVKEIPQHHRLGVHRVHPRPSNFR